MTNHRVHQPPAAKRWVDATLFASRWLMAPFYLGLVLALPALLVVFAAELAAEVRQIPDMTPERAILMSLSLIDLSLVGNLLVIMILAGYENVISKLSIGEGRTGPFGWVRWICRR
jgi:uncharacterized protein (TIGR00645 family)